MGNPGEHATEVSQKHQSETATLPNLWFFVVVVILCLKPETYSWECIKVK